MADEPALWNFRNKTSFLPSDTVLLKSKNVNLEIEDNLRKRLSVMSRCMAKNLVWCEMNTLKSITYKYHNQHCRDKYFHGIKRIQKHLTRLKEMELEKTLTLFLAIFPKKTSNCTAAKKYPCLQAIEYVLLKFMGASQLIIQAIGHCRTTFNYVCAQLSLGFFVTFHVVLATSLSRSWVLLKDLLCNIVECYEILFPWLDFVCNSREGSNTSRTPKTPRTAFPQCLKTWVGVDLDHTIADDQIKSKTSTPSASAFLDKLFCFTPATEKNVRVSKMSENVSNLSVVNGFSLTNVEDAISPSVNSMDVMLASTEPVPRKLFQDISDCSSTHIPREKSIPNGISEQNEDFPAAFIYTKNMGKKRGKRKTLEKIIGKEKQLVEESGRRIIGKEERVLGSGKRKKVKSNKQMFKKKRIIVTKSIANANIKICLKSRSGWHRKEVDGVMKRRKITLSATCNPVRAGQLIAGSCKVNLSNENEKNNIRKIKSNHASSQTGKNELQVCDKEEFVDSLFSALGV